MGKTSRKRKEMRQGWELLQAEEYQINRPDTFVDAETIPVATEKGKLLRGAPGTSRGRRPVWAVVARTTAGFSPSCNTQPVKGCEQGSNMRGKLHPRPPGIHNAVIRL